MPKSKKKLYIIIDIAGMIGSTLLPKILLRKNQIVIDIDNLKLGKIKFIKDFYNKKNLHKSFSNIDLDGVYNNAILASEM